MELGGQRAGGRTGWVRIVAWNAQRLRAADAAAAFLRDAAPDVVLLSEADAGMARTGNRDTVADVAVRLEMAWAFGVEFVELGLGDAAEQAALRSDAINRRGLHGNALLTGCALHAPAPVRLDAGGRWFTPDTDEPRVGGRMAVVGDITIDDTAVAIASAHLESTSDAAERADQMRVLLDAIDQRSSAGPAIIGGDLNTFGAPLAELGDRAAVDALRALDPTRFSWPVAYEPLFTVAAERGFRWTEANVVAPTTHHRPDGSPHHVPLKLDWVLVRGLDARRPTVIPAIGPDGGVLSDHDAVAVSVRVQRV